MVGETHVCTRIHIIFGVNNLTIARHHYLVNGGEVVEMDVLGGIGPGKGGGIVEISTGFNRKVFRL